MDEMTALDMTRQAMMVQDKTKESTGNALKALDETIQMGAQTAQEIKRQGEKLQEIEEGLEAVETNLKRADKQMRIFVRYQSF